MYEILIAWRSSGSTPIIPLTDFRKKIGVLDSEYKRMYDFKKYVLDIAIKQINEHTDITVKVEQHKTGRSITGFSFNFKQKKSVTAEINNLAQRKIKQLTDSQRHFFANKLSVLPEMGSYSQGTETFEQFAVRIAEMLKDYKNIEELLPYLQKVGFKEAS